MLMQRLAVQHELEVAKDLRTPLTDEQRKVLFGQTAESVPKGAGPARLSVQSESESSLTVTIKIVAISAYPSSASGQKH
jgi:hypothetical protein